MYREGKMWSIRDRKEMVFIELKILYGMQEGGWGEDRSVSRRLPT